MLIRMQNNFWHKKCQQFSLRTMTKYLCHNAEFNLYFVFLDIKHI